MLLQDFPYELITQIISNLDGEDISQFIQCNSTIYDRSKDDSFWFDLCRLNGIYYCHPDITWRELFCSGELSKMCPHLLGSMSSSSKIQEKKRLLWSEQSKSIDDNHILCLHSCCDFFGDATCYTDHHATIDNEHNITLKLSPLHTSELWCNSCAKAIGFDGLATQVNQGLESEKFLMTKIVRALISIDESTDDQTLVSHITEGRQEIESNIFKFQFRHSTMHVVEKGWHTSWLEFISGRSNDFPGTLTNKKLLRSDGSLDPTLSLGNDFELIGSLARWYIERIYGADGTIISSNDLYHNPDYCKLAHSIRLRQQMSQVVRYPPIFALSN